MFVKKKVIVKVFKPTDFNEICLLKKKVIVKVFEPKDSNKCVYQKKGYCKTF